MLWLNDVFNVAIKVEQGGERKHVTLLFTLIMSLLDKNKNDNWTNFQDSLAMYG